MFQVLLKSLLQKSFLFFFSFIEYYTHHPAGIAEVSNLNLQFVSIERVQGVY